MADAIFEDPRLAAVYDPLDADRSDLEVYAAIATELGGRSVLDIGCGTGTFACLLANSGLEVIAVDPAGASLDVARAKPGAERVRWIHGVATDLPPLQVDLVTMTANVAQVFLDDDEWAATLGAAHDSLRDGGFLVFETRDPAGQAWLAWNRQDSYQRVDIPVLGVVESWDEVIHVALPFVTFRGTVVFHRDGTVIESTSTLRFRGRDEVRDSLASAAFGLREIRDAPDRPGREFVFLAARR